MPIVSGGGGGGGGGGFAIPSTTNSTPHGTRLEIDEFGELFLSGTDANPGFLSVAEIAGAASKVTLGSRSGVDARGVSVAVNTVGGSSLGRVDVSGSLVTLAHAAPADVDVQDGECWLWLDQTPAATKLMVKAKDSGGTVRTAAVNLA